MQSLESDEAGKLDSHMLTIRIGNESSRSNVRFKPIMTSSMSNKKFVINEY